MTYAPSGSNRNRRKIKEEEEEEEEEEEKNVRWVVGSSGLLFQCGRYFVHCWDIPIKSAMINCWKISLKVFLNFLPA
jgi:hypothetical protein